MCVNVFIGHQVSGVCVSVTLSLKDRKTNSLSKHSELGRDSNPTLHQCSLVSHHILPPLSSFSPSLSQSFYFAYSHYVYARVDSAPRRLVLSPCRKCQRVLSRSGSVAAAFSLLVQPRPVGAAGGHSHLKITMSHPGDLCMSACSVTTPPLPPSSPHPHLQHPTNTHTHTQAHITE